MPQPNSNTQAFTLIELLIVVAIIAILAAIAVPNFLEAQTRSKVSRMKADMRSMATAVEAYYVDNNKYPWPAGEDGVTLPSSGGVEVFETKLPVELTSPVSYITSLPRDIFNSTIDPDESKLLHYGPRYYQFITEGNTTEFDEYVEELFGSSGTIQYFMLSHGPDKDHDSPDLTENPLGPALYDPTNGTISSGDIIYWGPGGGFRN